MECHVILGHSGPGSTLRSDLVSAMVLAGLDGREPAYCRQVHSNRVSVVRTGGLAGEGDGLLTDCGDVALCIQTADCVPVFMTAHDAGIVSLVHAGWRGTSKRIVVKALQGMKVLAGVDPQSVEVFMGPSIRSCCYEVGPDVASLFDSRVISRNDEKQDHLDLPGANRLQLEAWGVESSNISEDARCTSCDPGGFHSYRRDGTRAGRMICIMALRSAGFEPCTP